VSLHRRAARRDTAEAPIVETLEACGFSVERLSVKGCGDLLLGKAGVTRVVEIKTDAGELTPDQVEWWEAWRGNPRIILRTVDDAIRLAKYWTMTDRNLWVVLSQLAAQ